MSINLTEQRLFSKIPAETLSASPLLIATDWFPPAEGGGGLKTAAVSVGKALCKTMPVYVLSTQHSDAATYPQTTVDYWKIWDRNAFAHFLKPRFWCVPELRAVLRKVEPEAVFMLSVYSWVFTLQMLWAIHLEQSPCRKILAPSGMFSERALSRKRWKKIPFLRLLQRWSLFKNVVFQAASPAEARATKVLFPDHKCVVAGYPAIEESENSDVLENRSVLKLGYLGRIESFKGLHRFLATLEKYPLPVHFTIAGHIENQGYWRHCQKLIERLPAHITCMYAGIIPNREAVLFLSQFHLSIMPSESESFGYAILESLQAGTPVLATKNSPWQELETKHAGYQVDFEDVHRVTALLSQFQRMQESEYLKWRENATVFAAEFANKNADVSAFKALFGVKIS